MNQNNQNFKKINNYTTNPNISIPRFSRDDNIKRFFPNALKSNRTLQTSNDNINQTECTTKLSHVGSTREFGKDLTNYYLGTNINAIGSNSSLNLERKPSLNKLKDNNQILNFIKPIKKREESKKKLKNEISLYNLRPRGNGSNSNSRTNSVNNSLCVNNNINNENVNTMNTVILRAKNITKVFDSNEMDIDMSNDCNKINVEEADNVPNIVETIHTQSFKSRLSTQDSTQSTQINNTHFSIYNQNPQIVSEYIDEIYSHLKSTEDLFSPKFGYLKNQRDINEKMRGILIDWLVDVHLKFKLLPETLFLTTELIDRYLEKEEINRNKLQLVGVSSLFIACKYEEIYPPELKDFVYITDKAYTKEDILKMEYHILSTLNFNLTSPSSLRLLEVYLELIGLKLDEHQQFFAKYLLELFLVDYRMIKYSPSWIAASTIYITMKVKKFNSTDGSRTIELPKITGYTEEKIKECARDICIVLDYAERSSLQAVRNKYSMPRYLEVAKWKKN